MNELYELSLGRLHSIEFTLFFTGLFLEGLNWINLKYMVPSTQLTQVNEASNSVLCYFIVTFVFTTIALIQICTTLIM